MQVFQPCELLDLWERGRGQHPVDRALTLLGAVHRGMPRRELAEWCLGERDTVLLALHRSNFGLLVGEEQSINVVSTLNRPGRHLLL